MSEQPIVPPPYPGPGAVQAGTVPARAESLADGEWHRMHPLTPLFKGGLVLLIVGGFLIANLRDRLITWVVDLFEPDAHYSDYSGSGDPVDWVLSNNLVLLVLLGILVLVVALIAVFWVIWRFHQFRITGDHVEVRKGIVFRSHRRAPLDRVQGVNLTRPFPARIIGLAKLEVLGAGTDANVDLEYLATSKAEWVRADILRLASGARAARESAIAAPGSPASTRAQFVGSVNQGVTGLIAGVDLADVAPESVVKIPTGRLVGSQLISSLLWAVFFLVILAVSVGGIFIAGMIDGEPELALIGLGVTLAGGIPLVIALVGITWAQISKSLRYSIAPTADGVRITYGLLTTVTETLPPGRIFAVEVSQSLLWRPFGWWTIRINRMSGKSAAQQQSGSAQQFNVVLPVGKRADVERVLALILPDAPVADIPLVWEHGILGPVAGDPYRTMPGRAWWRRPFSWKRHGYAVTEYGLLLRRGVMWRKLAVFPLARIQGISLSQGPIDRAQRVSGAQVHSVTGVIHGLLAGLDRADALELVNGVSAAAALAATRDHSHRWGTHTADASAPAAPQTGGFPGYAPNSGHPLPPQGTAPVASAQPGQIAGTGPAHPGQVGAAPTVASPAPGYPAPPAYAAPSGHPAPPAGYPAHPAPPAAAVSPAQTPQAAPVAPPLQAGPPAPPALSAAHPHPAPPAPYQAPRASTPAPPAPSAAHPHPAPPAPPAAVAPPAPPAPPTPPATRAEARLAAETRGASDATEPADPNAATPPAARDE